MTHPDAFVREEGRGGAVDREAGRGVIKGSDGGWRVSVVLAARRGA